MFSDIPEELVVNILMRLSVKSLKILSCVNKWWYNLIQSRYFISRHYSFHSSGNAKLLVKYNLIETHSISILSETDGDCSHLSIPFFDEDSFSSIIGPCINGIICMKNFSEEESYKDIALWNIATGEYHILPKLHFSDEAYFEILMEGVGFGWVPEANEYKVVMAIVFWQEISKRVDHVDDRRPNEVFVYTLSTNSWKQLSFETRFMASTLESDPPFNSQIYVNGVCYWANENIDGIYTLFSFHLRDEIFGSLPLPELDACNCDFLRLTLHMLDGCIALINHHAEVNSLFLVEIWVMEESWIKKFTIGPLINICVGVGLVKDELFLSDENGELLSINIYSHDLKSLDIEGDKYSFQVLEYMESLVPLKRRL